MSPAAFRKFCKGYLELKPNAKPMRARVLLPGGVWVDGDVGMEDQVVVIKPPSNAQHSGHVVVEVDAIIAIQMIL